MTRILRDAVRQPLRLIALTVALSSSACSRIDSTLLSTHMENNQRAAAKERWDSVRGSVKLQLAEGHLKAGRLEAAEKALDEALAMMPNDPNAYLIAARIRLAQGQIGEARQAVAFAAALSPGDPEIHYLAGQISQRQDDLPSAFEHYATAAELSPQTAAYLLAEAEVLVAMNRPTDALELVHPRLIDFDQNVSLRMLSSRIARIVGLRGPAVEFCRDALRICDGDKNLQTEYGNVLHWASRYEEAIRVLEPLAEQTAAVIEPAAENASSAEQPSRPSTLLMLADAYLNTSKPTKAMSALRRVMKECPENMTAWRVYARAAVQANDFESAIESLDHVIANSAMTSETWVLLAYVALRSGDSTRSREAGQRAILEEPGLAAAHFLVGEAAETEGDVTAARESYRQVLKLEPDFEPAARRLNLLSMRVEAANPEFAGDCPDDVGGMEP
ncbi:MAG: tetratricopeptide repeat protein [Planctomycetia bacterium]|nr:tetratricopeptide repeat protein [Planctomycetia bacterium]MCC7316156.1 tetratricopeptide repeat protein [Planctomycetota bacterium]OQZ03887.1 MAG: hypothetical protein B6D36_12155 [Planctomycetes bacterium UTPLA1]